MDDLYRFAIKEIKEKANKLGANAIVGLKLDFGEITGKGKDMFMLSAVGTAVIASGITYSMSGDKEDAYTLAQAEMEQANRGKSEENNRNNLQYSDVSSEKGNTFVL